MCFYCLQNRGLDCRTSAIMSRHSRYICLPSKRSFHLEINPKDKKNEPPSPLRETTDRWQTFQQKLPQYNLLFLKVPDDPVYTNIAHHVRVCKSKRNPNKSRFLILTLYVPYRRLYITQLTCMTGHNPPLLPHPPHPPHPLPLPLPPHILARYILPRRRVPLPQVLPQ